MYSPVLENRKTTNIRHSTLQPPHIYYKTSQNNRNNQNDSLMLNVYKLWVSSGIFPSCYHLLVGWNRTNIWALEDVPLDQFKLPDAGVKAQLHYTTACDNTSLYWRHKVKVNFDVVNWEIYIYNAYIYITHCWLIRHPFPYKQWQTRANKNADAPTKTNPANWS